MHWRNQLVVAAALIRRDDEILLIEQQGPDHPEPTWALPGGIVKDGELITAALVREVREETGLVMIDPGRILYTCHLQGKQENKIAFIFDVKAWTGELLPDDPDLFILDARFLTIPDAIVRLETLPWRHMGEPIIEYLREPYPHGALWSYREDGSGNSELVERSPSFGVDAFGSM